MSKDSILRIFIKGSKKQKLCVLIMLIFGVLYRAFLGIQGFMVVFGAKMSLVMFSAVYCLTSLPCLLMYLFTRKHERNRLAPVSMEDRQANLRRMF